jgi:hypothetical protein
VSGLLLPYVIDAIVNSAGVLISGRAVGLNTYTLNTVVPAGYFVVAVAMAEFWLRPYMRTMEKVLHLGR